MNSWLGKLFGGRPPLVIHGIPVTVINTRSDISTDDILERLTESLALIAQYAPRRWWHLQRDVRMIRVERFPTRGAFFPQDQIVLTELTFLARRDISAAPVASSILHEGVHARVHAFRSRVMRGFPPAPDMAREERLCRRAEFAFGGALPAELGAPVIERARQSLELTDGEVAPVVDWSLARARQDEADRGGTL